MKLDVLSGHEQIGICVGYKLGDETITDFPPSTEIVSKLVPIIEYMPGWKDDLTQIKSVKELSLNVVNFINFVS